MQHKKNSAPETGRQTKTEWQMVKLRRYRSQAAKVWNGKDESGPGVSVELVAIGGSCDACDERQLCTQVS